MYIRNLGQIQKILVKMLPVRVWGEGRPVQGWTWDLTSPHPSFFIFILENFKATEKLRKKLNIEHPYILCLDSLINR